MAKQPTTLTLEQYLHNRQNGPSAVTVNEQQTELYRRLQRLTQPSRQTLRFGIGSEYLPSL